MASPARPADTAVHRGDHADPTGAKADRRHGCAAVAAGILAKAIVGGGEVTLTEAELEWAKEASGAEGARGRSLLTIGRFDPPQVQALALEINRSLGSVGKTCACPPQGFVPGPGVVPRPRPRYRARRVSALLVLGAGPSTRRLATFRSPRFTPRCRCECMRGFTSMRRRRSATGTCRCRMRSRTGAMRARRRQRDHHPARRQADVRQPVASRDPRRADLGRGRAAQSLVRQTWAASSQTSNSWANALKIGFVAPPQQNALPGPRQRPHSTRRSHSRATTSSRSSSARTRRSRTAASPTTAGSRSSPSRCSRSHGTT